MDLLKDCKRFINFINKNNFKNLYILFQELAEMRSGSSDSIRIIDVNDNNLLHWSLLLIPVCLTF